VEVKCLPTVNYSLVHAEVPFLSEVTLFNDGDAPLMDGRLQLALSGYAESEMVTIPTVPAKGSHMVNPLPKFTFKREKLKDLPTPETVTLEAWVNDERMPLNPPVEVKVLPPNAWHCVGHEKALAGFVMPNSDAVDEIITRARRFLQRLLKKAQGFADALESADPKAVEKTLKAVYFCLQERYDITYEYEPHFDAPDWQMIRFHHKVLDVDELEGTCIDLALLFAACLENVHRQPLIIIVKTGNGVQHAVIGCWRERSLATAAVIRDEAQLRRWVKSGEILVLDSKGFPKTKEFPERMPFARCQKEGKRTVENYPLVYALNILAARDAGIAPMQFGKGVQFDRAAWLAKFRAKREAEKLQSESVGARHLLLGLLSLDNGLMRQVFAQFGDDVADKVIDVARKSLKPTASPKRSLSEDKNWQAVMKRAEGLARETALMTETDLATALLETPSRVDEVLKRVGLTQQQCLDKLRALIAKGVITSGWHSAGFTDD
jgi:hypothetical protein